MDHLGFALFVIAWIIHGWLTFRHPHRIGTEAGDSRRDPTVRTREIQWGLTALWLGQALAGFALGLSLPDGQSPPWLPGVLADVARIQLWPSDNLLAMSVLLGTATTLAGVGIRVWAIRTLGRYFTFEIGIRSQHPIIQAGPYRWLRHPSYTGYLLLLMGMALLGRSLGLWVGTVLPAVGFILKRIHDEERMLGSHFGEAYAEYSRRTWRLIPGLY